MKDKTIIEPGSHLYWRYFEKTAAAALKSATSALRVPWCASFLPITTPFPAKRCSMPAGVLKERLVGNPDIWLCYNCGDCSTRCPRGANPGETLAAVRRLAVKSYSKPKVLGHLFDQPRALPLLLVVPALIILAVGYANPVCSTSITTAAGLSMPTFFPVALIEMIFIPLSILSGLVFFNGIKRLLADMKD